MASPLVARAPCDSAHAYAVEHNVRALRGRVQIGLHGDREAAIQTPDDLPSHPRDGLGATGVEVEEAQLVEAQNIAGLRQTVNHQRRPNSAASEYRYLVHELSSTHQAFVRGKAGDAAVRLCGQRAADVARRQASPGYFAAQPGMKKSGVEAIARAGGVDR